MHLCSAASMQEMVRSSVEEQVFEVEMLSVEEIATDEDKLKDSKYVEKVCSIHNARMLLSLTHSCSPNCVKNLDIFLLRSQSLRACAPCCPICHTMRFCSYR